MDGIADLTVLVGFQAQPGLLVDAARDFDVFYQERIPAPAAGSILVAAVDGKGVPRVPSEGSATDATAHPGTLGQSQENGHGGRRVY
jgi:hypothetical protein